MGVPTAVTIEVFSATHALRSRHCIAKGDAMHSAAVDKGMLGANGSGTLAAAVGQIAAASTGYGCCRCRVGGGGGAISGRY